MAKFGFDTKAALTVVTPETATERPALTDTPLDYALRYAALGWYVIPVRRDKKPLDGYGLNSATNDPALIRKIWGTQHPDANIAVHCEKSGLVVLDIDPRNGGEESLAQFEAEHGVVHTNASSLTQGGGEHRLFRAEPGAEYPGTLGAGLDLKHRGYILVEPSRGESGVYRWAPGRDPTAGSLPSDVPPTFQPRAAQRELSAATPAGSVIVPEATYEELRAALRVIPADSPYPDWLRVLQGLSRLSDTARAYELAREWSTRSSKPGHTESAFKAKWRSLMREGSLVSHATVFYKADEYDRGWRGAKQVEPSGVEDLPGTYSLDDFDLNNLPPIKFVIPDWLPAGKLTLFSGHGGSGKSSVMLQLGTLLAAGGQHLLGHQLRGEPYRVFFVSGEDEPVVNMTRLRGILRLHPHVDQDLIAANFRFMNVAGCRTTTLVDFDPRTGKHSYTSLYEHLKETCERFQPDLIITDNNSILFGGNEIDRNQIQTYIHCVQNIYPPAAVVALHHVDKASVGREDGDGWSGSTQWHNAARARWTLSVIGEEMTLYLRKSNYGHDGWRGTVSYDEHARAHRLGEFSRLTREQESTLRIERKEQAKLSAMVEREQEDRATVLGAISRLQDRYPSHYGVLNSLGARYEAYKKVLQKLIDEGEVLEAALPAGVKGESNRQKTYVLLRDREDHERYKI
jgi:RecA-family ATPase